MFCTKCGNQVGDKQKFCPKCGQSINATDKTPLQGGAPKTKNALMSKVISFAMATLLVAAFVGYKYYSGGMSMEQMTQSATGLLKQALEENTALSEHVDVREVKDCVLVKESENKYSGIAKVVFMAKKTDSRGRHHTVTIQYGFEYIIDGENVMLQNGKAFNDDATVLSKFLTGLMMGEDDDQSDQVNAESEDADKKDDAVSGGTSEMDADTMTKEYENILREAMPVVLALQGMPNDKIEATVEKELKEETLRFWLSTVEVKMEKLRKAREEILPKVRAMKEGGAKAQAVIKEASEDAEASALAMQGRNLFVAITQANVVRELAGLGGVWPRSQMTGNMKSKDISERIFESATEYFTMLFGEKYVTDVEVDYAITKDAGKARWHVAKGITEEMDDCIPVLVSSNVDSSSLVTKSGRHEPSKLAGELRFTGSYAVVVFKGGNVSIIKKKDALLANVYGGKRVDSFTLPLGFGYLTPEKSGEVE